MAPARQPPQPFSKDEKVLCFHGEMLYEAKILDIQPSEAGEGFQYRIHYKGWKNTWDDWVSIDRIRKFTEENKELASQLHAQMKDLRQKSSAKAPKKGTRANGTDSLRGSEERTAGVAASGRGPRRARDFDLEQTSIINLILPLYLLDSGFFFISYSALNTTDADFNADQTYSDVIVIRLLSIAKMSFRGDRTEPWLAGVDDRYSYYNLPTVLPIRDNEEHDPAVRLSAPSTSAAQGESFTQGHREPSPASLAGSESWDEVECYCSMCERAQEDADEIAQRNFETGRVYLRDGQDYLESSQRDLQDSETHIEDGTEQFSDGDEVDWDAVPRNVEYDGGNGLIYDDEEIISYVDDGERSPYYGPHSEDEADGMDYAEDGERSPDNGPRPEEDGENDMYEEDSSYYEDPAVRDERIEANYNAFSSQWNVVNWEAGARRPVEPPVSPMTRLAARFDETTNSFYGEDSPGHSSDSSNSSVVFLWESPANSQENLRERPALMSNSPKQESSQTPVSSESGDSDFKTSIAKKRKREASCEIVFEFKRNVRPRST